MARPAQGRATLAHMPAAELRALLLLVFLVACDRTETTRTLAQPTIYGTDDRTDVYAHPDARLRALAQGAAVALIPPSLLDATNPADIRIVAHTLGVDQNLSSD